MALVNVTNIVVLDNPTSFTNPFTFEVTFECLQALEAGECLRRGGTCSERGVASEEDDEMVLNRVMVVVCALVRLGVEGALCVFG